MAGKLLSALMFISGVLCVYSGILMSFAGESSAWLINYGNMAQESGITIYVEEEELLIKAEEPEPDEEEEPEPDEELEPDEGTETDEGFDGGEDEKESA